MTQYVAGKWRMEFLSPRCHRRPGANECVTYLANGMQVICRYLDDEEVILACDAELLSGCVRESIVQRYGFPEDPESFARAWTTAEVQAKLTETPIVIWLQNPRFAYGAETVTHFIAEMNAIVTMGLRRRMDGRRSETTLQPEANQRRHFSSTDDEYPSEAQRMTYA